MGFAGQIFAARVAVGLAVPSSQALSSAGQTLANGISGIYGQLNKKRVEAAKQREGAARAEMQKADNELAMFRANAGSKLRSASADQLAQLNKNSKVAQNAIKSSALSSSNLMGQLQTSLQPKLAGQMMQGVSRSMSNLEKAQQMTKNFVGLKKSEQDIVMKTAQMNADNAKAALKLADEESVKIKDRIALKIKEGEEMQKDWKRLSPQRKKKLKEFNEELDAMRKIADQGKENRLELQKKVNESENELVVMKQVSNATDLSTRKIKGEEEALSKNAKTSKTKYEKAKKDATKVIKQATTAATQFGQKIAQNAQTMSVNFTNALRDTIAVMTAFYYKLSQNTQELIAFERELMNANSVFAVTKDELFATSNQIVEFGQQFGLEMQNGATGLYQLASAGLSADEAMQFLPHTLKLSMAVQGDHNTIAKLTTQTLAGFSMEADKAGEITDKFAHAIQKSLIEYEDLSSAVKFALPFFTATGQSVDQLLGALQVLTNRALEAGIAGRGLRQALAEFAENADNNEAAFRKMGIEIKTATGEMKPLTEIASDFATVVGEDTVSNTELLTTLIDDLNVRGATAFIHLVQASDEFTQAVHDTENATGELDRMVKEQNESMSAQIQILKNNVQMMFFYRDAAYEGTEFMNGFHEAIVNGIKSLQDLFVTQENGAYVLTTFGKEIQQIAIRGVKVLGDLLVQTVTFLKNFTKEGMVSTDMLKLFTLPLKITLDVLQMLGPNFVKMLLYYQVLNKILPISVLLQSAMNKEGMIHNMVTATGNKLGTIGTAISTAANFLRENGIRGTYRKTAAMLAEIKVERTKMATGVGLNAIMGAEIVLTNNATKAYIKKAIAMAAAMLPYVAIAAAVGLLIGALYVVNKETGVFSDLMYTVGQEMGALKGVFLEVFENTIYPFIYRIGLEFMALSAIIGFAMIAIAPYIEKYVINPFKFLLFEVLVPIGKFIIDVLVWAINGVIWAVKGVVKVVKAVYDGIVGVYDKFMNTLNLIKIYGPFAINQLKLKLIDLKDKTIEAIREKTMAFLEAYVELGDYIKDTLQGVFEDLLVKMEPLFSGAAAMRDAFKDAATYIADLVASLNVLDLDVLDKLSVLDPREYLATGGYVKPMASGGMIGSRRPYMVGERGPELFMPSSSGQVINNSRTESIMRQGLNAGPAMKGGAQEMVVSQLVVGNAKLKNTRMGVDTFAGVV